MTPDNQQLTIKNLFGRDEVRNKFQEMLGKRAPSFITSVLQIVASNDLLLKADPHSVYHSAAVAATLDLPLNNNLGFAYIVPYNQSYKDNSGAWQKRQVAQFQMGYKGFIQLAQRTGMYKTLSASPIYEGQLVEENPLTGFVFDFKKKVSEKIIGYASYFQLLNGFEKTFYVTVEEISKHGKRYSQTFKSDRGLWVDNFEAMALKTVIKLNLSKWAPLSVDIQKAITFDQAVINNEDATDISYVDNEEPIVDKENERMLLMIADAKTIEDLDKLGEHITAEQVEIFDAKRAELKAKK